VCHQSFIRDKELTPSLISLTVIAALAAEPEVNVRPLEGESFTGRLVELSAAKAVIKTSGGQQGLTTAKLMWMEFTAASPADKPTIWVELLDGSRLSAVAFAAAQGKAQIELATRQKVEIPTRAIHTVRFHQQTPELAAQWAEIVSSKATGDMLITRKTSMRTIEQADSEPRTVTEQALDQLEGTILEVTDNSVQFEIDGDKIPARREKLEGLVYYHKNKRELSSAVCRLVDAAGSVWQLRELSLTEDRLRGTTSGNVNVDWPLTGVARLDYSVGNVAFLSDLEADSGIVQIPVSVQPAAMTYKLSRIFHVHAGPPLGADSFRIGGQQFENGLSLHSPTKLVYRVPQGFKKFFATVGVDDTVVAPGRFRLMILGDGKELARHDFSADERRKPVSLSLDVSGVRRLTIQVEAAEGQDIGDQLDLCEARFTK